MVLDTPSYCAAPSCPGIAMLLSPAGVPQLTVRAKAASAAEVSGVIWSAVIDGATLSPLSVSDCGDADATTQCADFAAPGCQPMVKFADGSCSFANEVKTFKVTAMTSLGVTTKGLNAGLLFPGRKIATCSVPLTTPDGTVNYEVAFSAAREDGSVGIWPSQPIVSDLKLLDGNATGALSSPTRRDRAADALAGKHDAARRAHLYARGEAAPHDVALLAVLRGRALVPHHRLGQRRLLLLLRYLQEPARHGATRRLGRVHRRLATRAANRSPAS